MNEEGERRMGRWRRDRGGGEKEEGKWRRVVEEG